ncbi:MAG TPA: hypothetical protein VFK80_04715 [Limnochordia bacterium]|nr:hypothetical protein [Limnochordia bacterium]
MTRIDLSTDVDVTWRTVVGEARAYLAGDVWLPVPFKDMQAVAYSIRERVLRRGWWGTDYAGVAQNKSQYNAWGDPKCLRVMRDPFGSGEDPAVIWRALSAAVSAVYGRDEDCPLRVFRDGVELLPTHYHNRDEEPPVWATDPQTVEIHPTWDSPFRYYCNVPGNPPRAKR